jgi:hypothetical protein
VRPSRLRCIWTTSTAWSAPPSSPLAGSNRLARYAGSRGTNATEQERRSFGALAPACSRYGLRLVDHVIVAANGSYGSVPLLRS